MAGRRRSSRVVCALTVTDGSDVTLGEAGNISLEGMYLKTDRPLEPQTILPIHLTVEGHSFRADAEVAHLLPGGVGLRFVAIEDADHRKLRHFVNDLVQLNATRRNIRATLDGPREPVSDPVRIHDLLHSFIGTRVDVVSAEAAVRQPIPLTGVGPSSLQLGPSARFHDEETVLCALTVDFVCWSFECKVLSSKGVLRLSVPTRLSSNERRANQRTPQPAGTLLSIGAIAYEVIETGNNGLAVRTPVGVAHERGDQLGPAVLHRPGRPPETLTTLEVRHVKSFEGNADVQRLGLQHVRYARTPVPVASTVRVAPSRWTRRLTELQVLAGSLVQRVLGSSDEAPPATRVSFRRPDGLEVVAHLETTGVGPGKRNRAPLVVVVPAFAGRKEQFCGYARLVTALFAQHQKPVAVLRIDGTNNLGESGKAPGFVAPGLHTMRFTAGGVIEDLEAVLAWAENNPHLDVDGVYLLSASFASVPVRALLRDGSHPAVKGWIAHMGAADAQNSILHVSGHIDAVGLWRTHGQVGEVMLAGCPVDADLFCADLERRELSTLEHAKADLSRLRVPVVWVVGQHDVWVDRRLVVAALEVMSPEVPHAMVEFDSGHLPTSGVEALQQFAALADLTYEQVHGVAPKPWTQVTPATLKLRTDEEWARVRTQTPIDRTQFWREYMVGDGQGVGFDLMSLSGGYVGFAQAQAEAIEPNGRRILELGAGTGLVSLEMARRGAQSLVLVDLIEDAVQRALARVRPLAPVEAITFDLEAGPLPFEDEAFDGAMASLLLSYLGDPSGVLAEVHRVLKPGARLVVSSMRPGADTAAEFLDVVTRLERGDVETGWTTASELVDQARRFHGLAAGAFRLEEEGLFQFFDDKELIELVTDAGFVRAWAQPGFGSPSAAWIVTCERE